MAGIFLHSRHKEHSLAVQLVKPVVVHIAPVKGQDAVRFVTLLAGHLDFVLPTRCDHTKTRNLPFMIQHQVQLDGSFALAKLRPIKHFQAQVNDRGVQAVHFVSKLKTMARCQLPTPLIQTEKELSEDLGRTI